MRPRSKNNEGVKGPPLSILRELLSVPVNFFGGLAVGLVAPVAAVAGIVGGVYLFTKKVPFFRQATADETTGERSLTLSLMTPDEAKSAFESRLAELKTAWNEVMKDLAEISRQAGEESGSVKDVVIES
jgi:hypothetical protein